MKRILAACLCLLLLGCATPKQPQQTAAPAATETATPAQTATPEPKRFPVTEAIAPLPETPEAVDLGNRLLIYESDSMSWLYLHGQSIPLCAGSVLVGAYGCRTAGDRFFFSDRSDMLYMLDLSDPAAPAQAVAPDVIKGVKRFMISEDGETILYETPESEDFEVLYLYRNGEAKRIAKSAGHIDQFYLSPDGRSLIFYMDETDTDNDRPYSDYLIMDGGEPIELSGYIAHLGEDLQTVLLWKPTILTLLRAGSEPTVLSDSCRWVEDIAPNGACWWTDSTPSETLWYFDGAETTRIGDHMDAPRVRLSGAYAYFCNGVFWAKYQSGEPVRLCLRDEFAGGGFLDEHTLVYSTCRNKDDPKAFAHRNAYAVTVDETGVSEPVLIAENYYQLIRLCDGWLIVRSEDMSLCDLYFGDDLLGTDVRFWSDTRFAVDAALENLFFISDGRLYHFDGKTLRAILETDPAPDEFPLCYLSDGTLTYRDGDVLYYYDGTAFHRILEHADRCRFTAARSKIAAERRIHD
ncbi:MAG: hypothetical protein IJK88_02200 [Clostridia bacterium]|nr:hypothetical protein [Clostridia bacterium]